jgi:hypothetical protein
VTDEPYVVGWDHDEIVSEMEAMILFRRHKQTAWVGHWTLGGRVISHELLAGMLIKGLIDRFRDDSFSFERRINPKYDNAGGNYAASD